MYIDAIQTLHLSACDELGLGEHTKSDIEGLLADLRSMLEGVGMLRELTTRSGGWTHRQAFHAWYRSRSIVR